MPITWRPDEPRALSFGPVPDPPSSLTPRLDVLIHLLSLQTIDGLPSRQSTVAG